MSIEAKQAHRYLAGFIGIFLLVHFANHLSGLWGIAAHDAVLQFGRSGYRIPVIEVLLVMALAVQVGLGIALLRRIRARKRKGMWHWAQFLSGCYLAFFIVLHTSAALLSRWAFNLDTNFYWAAGTLVLEPLRYGFAPYYFLGVIALVGHLLAGLHFRFKRSWHAPALAIGPLLAIAIIASYGGAFFPVELPQEYLDYFEIYY